MKTNKWFRGARVKDGNGFVGTLIEDRDFNSLFIKVKYDHKEKWVSAFAEFFKLDRKRKAKV